MMGAQARRIHPGVLLLTLLAFGLRLYAIGRQDIWGDEAFSIWLSSQPLLQVVAGGADTHAPLYPFLLDLWLRLAGPSPLAARFLSALIGPLTVLVICVLGHRTFGRTAGGLAVLLAAVSPILIDYSQETRMDGLVTLLAVASVYWALRVIQEPRSAGACLQFLVRRPLSSFDGRAGLIFPLPGRAATVVVILGEDEATLPAVKQVRPDGEVRLTLCWQALAP